MTSTTGVLIVGGGPVGLSAALFLHHHEIPFILIEKDKTESILPRARGWHVRTLELFRQVGLEDAVQAAGKAAWEQGGFGGARRGQTMLSSEGLKMPSKEAMMAMMGKDPSPCGFCACPQTLLDPVLRQALEERGADLRYGCVLTGLSQDDAGVFATVRDAQGIETSISAEYLIGADGGRSFVRTQVGIGSTQTAAETHYLNIFFRADLKEAVRDRTFSQCEIANDKVRGIFLSKNNTTEWSFHLEYDPTQYKPIEQADAVLIELLRSAIGDQDVPIEILAKTTWSTGVRIADAYRSGRVFLAGDAAHTMPPWGGLNGNTGVADAHNLAWKLAAVMQGGADSNLLDSYSEERRPVAVRNGKQASLRSDLDARFEIETDANRDAFQQLQNLGTLQLKYRYSTGVETQAGTGEGTVEKLSGQPGTRFPHAWIERDGKRMSTLDLFGAGYVLLQSPASTTLPAVAESTVPPAKLYRAGTDFSFCDEGVTWSTLIAESVNPDVLIRPDGFIQYVSPDNGR